jgi:hypothetical protein
MDLRAGLEKEARGKVICFCEISSSHGGEYDVQSCLLGCSEVPAAYIVALMMEAARTSETSVDNYFTRQYIPEDNSEHHLLLLEIAC